MKISSDKTKTVSTESGSTVNTSGNVSNVATLGGLQVPNLGNLPTQLNTGNLAQLLSAGIRQDNHSPRLLPEPAPPLMNLLQISDNRYKIAQQKHRKIHFFRRKHLQKKHKNSRFF